MVPLEPVQYWLTSYRLLRPGDTAMSAIFREPCKSQDCQRQNGAPGDGSGTPMRRVHDQVLPSGHGIVDELRV